VSDIGTRRRIGLNDLYTQTARTTHVPLISPTVIYVCTIQLCTMWMKPIQLDLKSNNLSLNEAIDVAQNRPLWRLMSMFGTMHS